MAQNSETLEILNMIKEGTVSPDEGARLIEALNRRKENKDEDSEQTKEGPRWLNVEVRQKSSGKFKSLTPIRIPFSLIRLFIRFIPRDSSIPGSESSLDEILSTLESGKPIEFHSNDEEDGRTFRIIVE